LCVFDYQSISDSVIMSVFVCVWGWV